MASIFRRSSFWSGLMGVVVGAMLVSALPALASQVGDPFSLGQANVVNQRTTLAGTSGNSNLLVNNTGSGVALDLRTAAGVPPMRVNRAALVSNLNADRLDDLHASQLIRASFGSTEDAPDSDGNPVTITIVAPKPGILLMGGSIAATWVSTDDSYTCRLTIDGPINFGYVDGTNRTALVAVDGGFVADEDCATNGVEVVGAGTITVNLNIQNADSVGFGAASLWAIWVPFDGQGRRLP